VVQLFHEYKQKHEHDIEGIKSVLDNIHDSGKVVVLGSKGVFLVERVSQSLIR